MPIKWESSDGLRESEDHIDKNTSQLIQNKTKVHSFIFKLTFFLCFKPHPAPLSRVFIFHIIYQFCCLPQPFRVVLLTSEVNMLSSIIVVPKLLDRGSLLGFGRNSSYQFLVYISSLHFLSIHLSKMHSSSHGGLMGRLCTLFHPRRLGIAIS